MTLPAAAARAPAVMVNTLWIERRLLSTGQTDGRTDIRPFIPPRTAYYTDCVNNHNPKYVMSLGPRRST